MDKVKHKSQDNRTGGSTPGELPLISQYPETWKSLEAVSPEVSRRGRTLNPWTAALIISGLAVILTAGCSSVRQILKRPQTGNAASAISAAPSLSDSLWRAPLPVDTVILEEKVESRGEVAGPGGRSCPAIELRRGAGSAEIGSISRDWGYRVQLASVERKEDLQDICLRVEREFEIPAFVEKHDERYVLRIGAFLDKKEAEALRRLAVSFGYKHAWIVQTLILLGEVQHKE
ncbi:MAG: SPOR domain-containing protein [Gemmatimonadota bacterium]|nr:SPOR domain-containing protein [Gemmatimonadota bacterium]